MGCARLIGAEEYQVSRLQLASSVVGGAIPEPYRTGRILDEESGSRLGRRGNDGFKRKAEAFPGRQPVAGDVSCVCEQQCGQDKGGERHIRYLRKNNKSLNIVVILPKLANSSPPP